jgi:hypothetical protein
VVAKELSVCSVTLQVQSDSLVALAMTQKFGNSTPALTFLRAEWAIACEMANVEYMKATRIPGLANTTADYLSRPSKQKSAQLPRELEGVPIQQPASRAAKYYRGKAHNCGCLLQPRNAHGQPCAEWQPDLTFHISPDNLKGKSVQPPRQPHVSSHFMHECCLKILLGKFYINLQSGSNDRHHFVSGPRAHPFCKLGSDRAVLAELGLFSVPVMDQLHSNSLDHTAHLPNPARDEGRSTSGGRPHPPRICH